MMNRHRTFLPFLMVLLLALLVAACGSDESGSSDSRDAKPASKADKVPEPGSPEVVEEKVVGGAFAVTPELTTCMTNAGFSQDETPAAGGIVSWSNDSGAKVVIASSTDAALGIAGEIGTVKAPANVVENRVSAGPAKDVAAAGTCLDA